MEKGKLWCVSKVRKVEELGLFLFFYGDWTGGFHSLFGWYKDPCGTGNPS